MATFKEIATRAVQKLGVLSSEEVASSADQQKAEEKLREAHSYLETEGLLRWAYADIPRQVEGPLVLITAYMLADDFGAKAKPEWMTMALLQVQRYVNIPSCGSTPAVYF